MAFRLRSEETFCAAAVCCGRPCGRLNDLDGRTNAVIDCTNTLIASCFGVGHTVLQGWMPNRTRLCSDPDA